MNTKRLISLLLAVTLSFAMTAGVFAGEFMLDPNFHRSESDAQMIWSTSGTDGVETDMTIETFKAAQTLIIEFNMELEEGIGLAWLGDGNDWSWKDIWYDDVGSNILEVDVKGLNDWSRAVSGTAFKFFVNDYNGNWSDLKVVSAKFIGDYDAAPAAAEEASAEEAAPVEEAAVEEAAPAVEEAAAPAEAAPAVEEAAPAPVASSPKTGDNNLLFVFGLLLLVSAAGLSLLYISKKKKA